jgi:hypothetical protein
MTKVSKVTDSLEIIKHFGTFAYTNGVSFEFVQVPVDLSGVTDPKVAQDPDIEPAQILILNAATSQVVGALTLYEHVQSPPGQYAIDVSMPLNDMGEAFVLSLVQAEFGFNIGLTEEQVANMRELVDLRIRQEKVQSAIAQSKDQSGDEGGVRLVRP